MLRSRSILTLCAFAAIGACSGDTLPAVTLPAEVEMGVGETVPIAGTSYSLRFVGVTQDSRCPTDVQCIWAGKTVLQFTLHGTSDEPVVLDGTAATTMQGFSIRTVSVRPAPVSTQHIDSLAYHAKIRVERLSS